MSKLSPTQHADATRRCREVLDKMRGAMNGPEYEGDNRAIMLDIRDLVIANGWDAAGFAVRAWCDTIIDATPGAQVGKKVTVAFGSPDQTELLSPEHMLVERRWCAQVLAARFSADQVEVHRLIEQLPRNNNALIYLFRMCEIAAGILNSYGEKPIGPFAQGLYRETAPGVFDRIGDET